MPTNRRQSSRTSSTYEEQNTHHVILIHQNNHVPLELRSMSWQRRTTSTAESQTTDENPDNGHVHSHPNTTHDHISSSGIESHPNLSLNLTSAVDCNSQTRLYETIFGFTYTAAIGLLALPHINDIGKKHTIREARLDVFRISIVISSCAALIAILFRRRRCVVIRRFIGGVAVVFAALALVSLASLLLYPMKARRHRHFIPWNQTAHVGMN